MSIPNSVLTDLLQLLPDWRPQMYFKSSLVGLSHAMEDRVLASVGVPLVIATFQRERFYAQEAHRYQKIAQKTPHVYVLAAPESSFQNNSELYESIAFPPDDALAQEWHLVICGEKYSYCLICREKPSTHKDKLLGSLDSHRRFEGIWTSNRRIAATAAEILLDRIALYRPELVPKIETTKRIYILNTQLNDRKQRLPLPKSPQDLGEDSLFNSDPFVHRLMNYLQVGQYKLLKAYKSIARQEQKERLIRLMSVAIRRSLNPQEILNIAVEQLGQMVGACRSLVYRCNETSESATISHESLREKIPSIRGEIWPLQKNPLFQEIVATRETVFVKNTDTDSRLNNIEQEEARELKELIDRSFIRSWLLVPIVYQDRLLGILELHHCGSLEQEWTREELILVEAIANQVGIALIQAEAYSNLQTVNQQLEALEQTRSNLVAITGHELRTPLSTIQVCLESLATEPDMPFELRQVMLNTALDDAERMRKLIQDFLILSQLEGDQVEWNPEILSLQECLDLSLSHIRARKEKANLPTITPILGKDLPLLEVDGEWLVDVLAKLLDNACKFTPAQGEITIEAQEKDSVIQVTIADNGRGIEPSRLESIFDLFYQEEGALQRTTGGTGLGLALCRKRVTYWGGKIWAESPGKNQGSRFHFTIPKAAKQRSSKSVQKKRRSSSSKGKSRSTR